MAEKQIEMTDPKNDESDLEKRVIVLENEIKDLKSSINNLSSRLGSTSSYIEEVIPNTRLLSSNFIKRAFAVWGHYFVAQLIIALGVLLIYIILFVVLLSSSFLFIN